MINSNNSRFMFIEYCESVKCQASIRNCGLFVDFQRLLLSMRAKNRGPERLPCVGAAGISGVVLAGYQGSPGFSTISISHLLIL